MPQLRVASYNLYLGADLTVVFGATDADQLRGRAQLVHGQLRGTDFVARAAAVARLLARALPDVVGLQEVARWTRTTLLTDGSRTEEVWCDFLAELLRALDDAGTPYDAHAVSRSFRGGTALSDTEEMSVVGANITLVRRGSGVVVTGERAGEFTDLLAIPTGIAGLVFPVHRSWGRLDATVDGRAFSVVNTHLEAYDAPTRTAQRDELLELLDDRRAPVFLLGDLNAEPGDVGMPAAYQDAWAVAGGPGPGHTCGQAADLAHEDSRLAQRIDYVWVRGATVLGCRVVGDRPEDRTESGLWPSDHACVVADVTW